MEFNLVSNQNKTLNTNTNNVYPSNKNQNIIDIDTNNKLSLQGSENRDFENKNIINKDVIIQKKSQYKNLIKNGVNLDQ